MNNIAKEQNEKKQLERLSAQRELYSNSKTLYGLQIIGGMIVPTTLAIISLLHFQVALITAIVGVSFFVLDLLFIAPAISKRKLKAAKIQEMFDCDVLKILKFSMKASTDIAVEEVLRKYNAHSKIESNIENLKNWYPTNIGELNIAIARIICQRASCWWDKELRDGYINTIRTTSILIPVAIIIIGAIVKAPVPNVVLILSGLISFFRFANKEYSEHKSSVARLECALKFLDKSWDNILRKCFDPDKLDLDARMVQDEIFENRSKSPLILDFIYKFKRADSENSMTRVAERQVEQIKEASANF